MDSTTARHANMTVAENVQINQKKARNYVTKNMLLNCILIMSIYKLEFHNATNVKT